MGKPSVCPDLMRFGSGFRSINSRDCVFRHQQSQVGPHHDDSVRRWRDVDYFHVSPPISQLVSQSYTNQWTDRSERILPWKNSEDRTLTEHGRKTRGNGAGSRDTQRSKDLRLTWRSQLQVLLWKDWSNPLKHKFIGSKEFIPVGGCWTWKTQVFKRGFSLRRNTNSNLTCRIRLDWNYPETLCELFHLLCGKNLEAAQRLTRHLSLETGTNVRFDWLFLS